MIIIMILCLRSIATPGCTKHNSSKTESVLSNVHQMARLDWFMLGYVRLVRLGYVRLVRLGYVRLVRLGWVRFGCFLF